MMRHPLEHHHMSPNQVQRNPARMGMQPMGPPLPNQRTQQVLVSIQPAVAVAQSAMKTLFFMTVLLLLVSMSNALTVKELKALFGKKSCIEGVLVTMPQGATLITSTSIPQQQPQPKPILGQQMYHYDAVSAEVNVQQQNSPEHTNTNISSMPTNILAHTKEKTPMCLINELARYNKIQHQYRLTGEQGPAHKKLFTVTLKLGNEEYESEGASIKKAQHSAAALALQQTELNHPPPKNNKINRISSRSSSGTVTPTVELNALAMKRGERTIYILENGAPTHTQGFIAQAPTFYPRHNVYGSGQPRYNYDPHRNETGRAYLPSYETRYNMQYPRYPHPPGEAFSIRLRVGEREYPGVGYTVQAARHDAASKALDDIKQQEIEENQQCPLENVIHHNESVSNSDLKSPISLVHELALKRNFAVAFEVLSEKGPPHMKVFVTQCRVGDMVSEGEGNGKKISKKRAAEKMLEELSKLEPYPNITTNSSIKRKRVVTKKKQRNLIKINNERSSELIEEINPISRLIQIQQANKEKEPVYTVIEERGAHRRREFVIEASVNGHVSSGVGPNKKVAKRNAAEALLLILGYSNISPATASVSKPVLKVDKDTDIVEKPRKVTFMEEKQEVPPIGGSGGRQLVPGLLLVNDQSAAFQQNKAKVADIDAGITESISELKKSVQIQVPGKVSQSTQSVGAKEQLLYLAQLLGVQVQFSDFPKANHEMYLTLVSVSTSPPQFCHGEGPTTEASHEKAAKEALAVLSELGLDNVTTNIEEPIQDSSPSSKQQTTPKSGLNHNGVQK